METEVLKDQQKEMFQTINSKTSNSTSPYVGRFHVIVSSWRTCKSLSMGQTIGGTNYLTETKEQEQF
jgi:hypothetical protein